MKLDAPLLQEPGQILAAVYIEAAMLRSESWALWCRVINRYHLMFKESIFS